MTPELANRMKWFALCVDNPLVVAKTLRRRGFTIFAPYKTIRKRRRRGRRDRSQSVAVDVPVLRGYVFVGAVDPLSIYWPGLLAFNSVHGVVCHRRRPAMMPFSQLDRIKRKSWFSDFTDAEEARKQDEQPVAAETPALLSVGDSAEILSGPFEGYAIEVRDLDHRGDRNVVKFLTHVFGREVSGETPVDNVVAA